MYVKGIQFPLAKESVKKPQKGNLLEAHGYFLDGEI